MKILIFKDNADDRRLLRHIAERHAHEMIEAEDKLEGHRMPRSTDPIISDALMPVMDGFQFLRKISPESFCW